MHKSIGKKSYLKINAQNILSASPHILHLHQNSSKPNRHTFDEAREASEFTRKDFTPI